jgi:hypothetical protein
VPAPRASASLAAEALNSTSEGVTTLTSPGLGGMIVALGPTVLIGCVVAYGINAVTFFVSVLALVGIQTPFQGRVNSVYRLLSFGAMSTGAVTGNILIDLYGTRPVMGLIAAWIATMAILAAFSDIRTLRE